jgi:hypothetical protein
MATSVKIEKISSAIIDGRNRPPRQLAALTHLPNRMDAAACLKILDTLHEDWTPDNVTSIRASGKQLSIDDVDAGLEYKNLSLEDRMILKAALAEHGFIERGTKRGSSTWGA